jgi:hypothetical protein
MARAIPHRKEREMDLSNFFVNPVTLALIVLGVVEFIKKFNVTGNKLMLVSMGVGISFALLYKARELYPPALPYIDVAFFGVAVGLGASGIYSFVNDRFPPTKATIRYTKVTKEPADKEDLVQ